jgi:cell wall-associated NlpC family hydrolase
MSVGAEPTPAGKAVIAEAMTWLGTPYRHQGSRKGVGCY